MCYGDPLGLIALWLCYKSEIILIAIGLFFAICFGVVAIVMYKKKQKEAATMNTLGKLISGRVKDMPSISIDEIENEW
jgi:hypothetical protein